MKDVSSIKGQTIVLCTLSEIGSFYRKQLVRARVIKTPTHETQKWSTIKLLEILSQVCDQRIKRLQTSDDDQLEMLSNTLKMVDPEVLVMAEALVQKMLMDVMEFHAEEKEVLVLEELEKVELIRQVLAQLAKDSVKHIGIKHEELRRLNEELVQAFFRPSISSTKDHSQQQYPESQLQYALETIQELQKEISLLKEENIQLIQLLEKTKSNNNKVFNSRREVPCIPESHKSQDATVLRLSDLYEDRREKEKNHKIPLWILNGSPTQAIDLLRTQLNQHQVSCVDILHDHIVQLEAALREADKKLMLCSNRIETLHGSSSGTTNNSSYTTPINSEILALQSEIYQLQAQLTLKTLVVNRSEKEYEQLREENISFRTILVTYKSQEENLRQIMLQLSQEKKKLLENLDQMKTHCRELEVQIQEFENHHKCQKEVKQEHQANEEAVIVPQQKEQEELPLLLLQQQHKHIHHHQQQQQQQQQQQHLVQEQVKEEKIKNPILKKQTYQDEQVKMNNLKNDDDDKQELLKKQQLFIEENIQDEEEIVLIKTRHLHLQKQLKQTQELVEKWKNKSTTIEIQKAKQIQDMLIYVASTLKYKSDQVIQQMEEEILQQHILPLYERITNLQTHLKKLKDFYQQMKSKTKNHPLYCEKLPHDCKNLEDGVDLQSFLLTNSTIDNTSSSTLNQESVKSIEVELFYQIFHQILGKRRLQNKMQEKNFYAHVDDALIQLYVAFSHCSPKQQQKIFQVLNSQSYYSKQNPPTKTSKVKRLGVPLRRKSTKNQASKRCCVYQQEQQSSPKMNTKISVHVATNTDSSMMKCAGTNTAQGEKYDASTNTFKAPSASQGTSKIPISTKTTSSNCQAEVPLAHSSSQTAVVEIKECSIQQCSARSNFWKWERLVFGSIMQQERSNHRKTQMKRVAEKYHESGFKKLAMKQNFHTRLLKKQYALLIVFVFVLKKKIQNSVIRAFFQEWKSLPSYSKLSNYPGNLNASTTKASDDQDDSLLSFSSLNELSTSIILSDAIFDPSMVGITDQSKETARRVASQAVQPSVPSRVSLELPPASMQGTFTSNRKMATTTVCVDDLALSHVWMKWLDTYQKIQQYLTDNGAIESHMQKFLSHCAELAQFGRLESRESSLVLTTIPSPRSMSKGCVPSLFSPIFVKDELKDTIHIADESCIDDRHQFQTSDSLSEGKSSEMIGSTSSDRKHTLSDELCSLCHTKWIRALNNERRRMNMENIKILEEIVKSLQTAKESHSRLADKLSLQSNKLRDQVKLHEQTKAFLFWKYSTLIRRLRSSYLNCSALLYPEEEPQYKCK